MKFRNIIIIAIAITTLIIICVTGVLLYFYTHPSAVVSLIERSIQKYTAVSLSMSRFSYSFDPFRIQAERVRVQPDGGSSGFFLQIPKVVAKLSFTGSFGRKSLVVENVELSEFSATYDMAQFRLVSKQPSSESFIGSLLRRAVAIFLFRNIRIDAINLTNGKMTAQLDGPVFTAENISAHRSVDRGIEIVSAVRLRWPSKAYDIDIPSLKLSTHDRVSLQDLALKAEVSAKNVVFNSPHTNVSEIGFKAEGNFDFAKQRVDIPLMTITIGEDFRLNGALNINGDDPKNPAILMIQNAVFLSETLLEMTPDRYKKNLPALKVTGEMSTDGSIKLSRIEDTVVWDYSLNVHLEQNPFIYSASKREIKGWATGMVEVRGSPTDVILAADLKLKNSEIRDPQMKVAVSDAKFSISGSYPDFQIRKVTAAISQLILPQRDKELSIKDIQLRMTGGGVDVDDKTLRLPLVQIELPSFGILEGMVEVKREEIHVRMDKQDVRILSVLKDLKFIPAGWEAKGRQSVSLDATLRFASRLSFDSRIYLNGFAIQDPTARLMGDNLRADIHLKGMWDQQDPSVAGNLSVNFTGGEFLYDLFYVNLNRNNLTATAEMTCDLADRWIDINDFKLTLKDTLSLVSSGRLDAGKQRRAHLEIQLPLSSLNPLFQMFLVEPFKTKNPFIATMKVSGKVSADLEISGTRGDWGLKGYCRWKEGGLAFKGNNIAIEKIDINYPLWYRSKDFQDNVEPLSGIVSIGSIRFPYIPEQPLQFSVKAKPNRLTVPNPIRINIAGGSILLGSVSVNELFSLNRFVKTHVTVNPTDITPVLSSIWSNPVSGSMKGRLDPVFIHGNRINGKGEITVEAFSGNITLSDFAVERFLSAAPLIGVNAEFEGLRLGQMTAGTQFGNIEGVLKGYLNNLQISYGQPQQFDLLMETVKKPKIKQEISIQAIENIAQIGSGQSPFVGLSGIFTSLFEILRYDKIGIRASLRNDIFRINGTIQEDRKEYLMKGGAISGVNIINQNPNNRISFKDMIKRIKRVTEGGKPVIN